MSDIKVQAVEPDPAATSIPNDETINKPSGDTSAPSLEDSATKLKPEETATTNTEAAVESKTEVTEAPSDTRDAKSEDKDERRNDNSGRNNNSGRNDRGGRGGYVDYGARKAARQKNNRFNPQALPETDDAGQIRAQVEFYFGDSNLPSDKFLWELTDGSTNNPVPLATIHSFKRMQRFQPYSAVVEALKSSPALILEGEEGKETIKRKVPYNPGARDDKTPRSVYVKGFGDEEPTSQFDIEAFFTNYGATRSVRLRRVEGGENHGLFKSSVFCEFQDEATQKKFLAAVAEDKPTWKGEDTLKIMSKAEYTDGKNQLIKEGKMQPMEARKFNGNTYNKRGGGRRDNDRDESDWRKRRDNDQKSGFRDSRDGRGGRGRGRGGRGRGGNRNNRDRDDDRDNSDRPHNTSNNGENASEIKTEPPQATEAKAEPASEVKTEASDNNKRPREDDSNSGEAPAKKQDTKETTA